MIFFKPFVQVIQVKLIITFSLLLFTLTALATADLGHPGVQPTMQYSEELRNQITSSLASKDKSYKPRTRHLENGHAVYTNRLILQESPYLLQHAHNPVNWYPWGQEAFETAKKENKPIFLSIGYATCHWCHVMEEESFENIEIAKILNQNFISIKVDREQYPDIDETYMTAVMVMTGSGGWPMSSFLMPDGRPFFGGTYFPPANFTDLLGKVTIAWKTQHAELEAQADQLSTAVKKATSSKKEVQNLGESAIQQAVKETLSLYDPHDGGFGNAPKFPKEPSLLLLLQIAGTKLTDPELQTTLQTRLDHTLAAMAQGGIYDQIGGGFHRYSTDPQWLVPHFEKMLYNQAYLARIYAQAWQQTANPLYARIARQTLDYVLREMTHASGGFYSATDADSEGEEGTYFVWSEEEINTLLDQRDAEFIRALYGVTKQGNFEGKNIFHLPQSLTDIALQEKTELTTLLKRVDDINQQLRIYREKRIPPLTDNKIIVAWNGMLITALVEVGDILGQQKYIDAAIKAAEFLWQEQRPAAGKLWRVNLDGRPSIPARQDDYAHLAEALIALYDVTSDVRWLQRSQALCDEMITKFWDNEHGAFLMGQDELLFAQPKDTYDNATPSGNSVAIRVLHRLAKRTGSFSYADKANEALQAFSGSINEHPASFAYMLAQLDEHLNGEKGTRQFAANGAVRISTKSLNSTDQTSSNDDQFIIELDIRDGWHINADKPLHQDLIATSISLEESEQGQISSVNYPDHTLKTLGFEEKPLALYEGSIQIKTAFNSAGIRGALPVKLSLRLQACNEEACLPPETIRLWFFYPLVSVSDAE